MVEEKQPQDEEKRKKAEELRKKIEEELQKIKTVENRGSKNNHEIGIEKGKSGENGDKHENEPLAAARIKVVSQIEALKAARAQEEAKMKLEAKKIAAEERR